MGEPLSIVASSIALAQLTDRVISLCKFYIQTARDYKDDLRVILVETSALKVLLENLEYLSECDDDLSTALDSLTCKGGVIEDCGRALTELKELFPREDAVSQESSGGKREKAKAALRVLAWPFKESKAKHLLDEITRHKLTITTAVITGSAQDIKSIKKTTEKMHDMLTEAQRQEVFKWLVQTDPSSIHNHARECYEPETCDWIFRLAAWTEWLEGRSRCLWVHGIPGAGKTVLVSHVVEWIIDEFLDPDNERQVLAYYYCYFGRSQDEAQPFLRWILNVLCRKVDMIPSSICTLFKNGAQPSFAELLDGIADILTQFETVIILLDAIDESTSRRQILGVLKTLATDPRFSNVRMLASSREYIDIENVIEPFSVSVSMGNPQVQDDIRKCVLSLMKNNPNFDRCSATLIEEIGEAVSNGAEGMFRWATCQIDILQRSKLERDVIERALRTLPMDLDDTYARIFQLIPEDDRDFVYYVLHWVYFHQVLHEGEDESDIPCSLLLEAAKNSIARSRKTLVDRYYDVKVLRDLCGCLLTFRVEDEPYDVDEQRCQKNESSIQIFTVSYAHYTVLEYMESHQTIENDIDLATDEDEIKEGLLRMLLWEACQPETSMLFAARQEAVTKNTPISMLQGEFCTYCITFLIYYMFGHAGSFITNDGLCDMTLTLINPTKPHFAKLQAGLQTLNRKRSVISLYSDDDEWRAFWDIEWFSPLDDDDAIYVFNALTFFGFYDSHFVTRVMRGVDTNKIFITWFSLARDTYSNITQDTRKLHYNGSLIEIMAQIYTCETPFRWLLQHATGFFDPSSILVLHIGCHSPHQSGSWAENSYTGDCDDNCPLKLLLKLGADPNAVVYAITSLQIAVECADIGAVKSLLLAGADPNVIGNQEGVFFHPNTRMKPFNSLLGYSPLSICRGTAPRVSSQLVAHSRDDYMKEIEKVLLEHGAEEHGEGCLVTLKALSLENHGNEPIVSTVTNHAIESSRVPWLHDVLNPVEEEV